MVEIENYTNTKYFYEPLKLKIQIQISAFLKLFMHIVRTPETVSETLYNDRQILFPLSYTMMFSALSFLFYEWIVLTVALWNRKFVLYPRHRTLLTYVLIVINICLYIIHIVLFCIYHAHADAQVKGKTSQAVTRLYDVMIGLCAMQSLLFSLPFLIISIILSILIMKRIKNVGHRVKALRKLVFQTLCIVTAGFLQTAMFCYRPITGKEDLPYSSRQIDENNQKSRKSEKTDFSEGNKRNTNENLNVSNVKKGDTIQSVVDYLDLHDLDERIGDS
eukprot:Pgem_evm1s3966